MEIGITLLITDPLLSFPSFQKSLKRFFEKRLDIFTDKHKLINDGQYG